RGGDSQSHDDRAAYDLLPALLGNRISREAGNRFQGGSRRTREAEICDGPLIPKRQKSLDMYKNQLATVFFGMSIDIAERAASLVRDLAGKQTSSDLAQVAKVARQIHRT